MAKQGMKRPDETHTRPKNDQPPVPEIQGKAKHGNAQAHPMHAAVKNSAQNAWNNKIYPEEKPISSAYGVIDSDLARDNLENDTPAADLQDI